MVLWYMTGLPPPPRLSRVLPLYCLLLLGMKAIFLAFLPMWPVICSFHSDFQQPPNKHMFTLANTRDKFEAQKCKESQTAGGGGDT